MSIEMKIRAFAGTVLLASLALSQLHSPYWLFLTAFVGANLLQSSMTRFCPLEMVLQKMERRDA